jgi:hypothetical protein
MKMKVFYTKKLPQFFTILVVMALTTSIAFAQTYIAVNAGNWTNTATWQGGVVPPSGASVQISNNVSADGTFTVTDLTIDNGFTLTLSSTSGDYLELTGSLCYWHIKL